MLKGLFICPSAELANGLHAVLEETRQVDLVRDLDRYPDNLELLRILRANTPDVLFVSTDEVDRAAQCVRFVEENMPGMAVVGVSPSADAQVLIQLVRAGVREFLSAPFQVSACFEALARVEEQVAKRTVQQTVYGDVYTFLPSKAGVGTTTLAVNAAVAMGRAGGENQRALLMDMDLGSGIVGFLLKISNMHSVIEAAENAHQMDESLWKRLVTERGRLDILHAGRLNPDFRINSSQVQMMTDFARRHYRTVCVDVSGNLERYSLEMMQESKQIFLVVTPEIPSLHLAREKLSFLHRLDLSNRAAVLLNRTHRRAVIGQEQIEKLLGVPVFMSFPNDYQGVHRALQEGKAVESASELGKVFAGFAKRVMGAKPEAEGKAKRTGKSKFVEYFSLLPGTTAKGG